MPVVLINVQKLKAPDYANTDISKWPGELYACGAVGEMVVDLERAGKRHVVITGVVDLELRRIRMETLSLLPWKV